MRDACEFFLALVHILTIHEGIPARAKNSCPFKNGAYANERQCAQLTRERGGLNSP